MRKLWIALLIATVVLSGILGVRSTAANPGSLAAAATINFHWKVVYDWTIQKSVSPAAWNLFRGDSGTSLYTISVNKSVKLTRYLIDGSICVTNKGTQPTKDLNITVSLYQAPNGTPIAALTLDVSKKPVLNPGETYCYKYSFTLDNATPGARYKVGGMVKTSNLAAVLAAAAGNFPTAPTNTQFDSINVEDTNGMSWSFSASGSVSYPRTFTCGDEGIAENTAWIKEYNNRKATASVAVKCYDLSVSKTAETHMGGGWNWQILKSASADHLTLQPGETAQVSYTVTLSASLSAASQGVAGQIVISNPAPMDAPLTAVSDVISDGIPADVDCPALTVPAGGSLTCAYSAALPDTTDRVNTATATLQNFNYDSNLAATPAGTTDFSGSAAVSFANASTDLLDECVSVTDDRFGALGTVCADDASKTFTYTLTIGGYGTCGLYEFTNTAAFTAQDSGAAGSSRVTIPVKVPCTATGCTYTQGYWKTHSRYGPAAHPNPTWDLIAPAGPDSPFFLSGMSWIAVFDVNPRGNAYFILAHQYMAARLNVLQGASTTAEVDAALASAEAFFNAYAPDADLSSAARAQALADASVLDLYNNGAIGPGHCSE